MIKFNQELHRLTSCNSFELLKRLSYFKCSFILNYCNSFIVAQTNIQTTIVKKNYIYNQACPIN